jgi:membrane-bound lytic murein transglycosylase D
MLVKAGSTLLVPRNGRGHDDVSEEIAENAMMMLAPEHPPRRRVKGKVRAKGAKPAIAAVSSKSKGKSQAKAPAAARSAKAKPSGGAVKLTGKAAARR